MADESCQGEGQQRDEDEEDADGADVADMDGDDETGHEPLRRRAVCSGCSRPASVCLCSAFPQQPVPLPADLRTVLLLRHPKERRQKHQSAWLLERCLAGVRRYEARRLPDSPPAGLEFLYDEPQSCLLVFPAAGAKPLRDVLDADVRHLVFVDATWRFAKEMVTASGPLASLRCVILTPPAGTRPAFVVRKPLLLGPLCNAAAGQCAEETGGIPHEHVPGVGTADGEEEHWGFCTAEAVALAVDEVQRLRDVGHGPGDSALAAQELWPVVERALSAYSQKQLERTTAPRARTDRPGYIPRLYETAEHAGCADGDGQEK